jgi:hypothetical protein
VSFHRADIKAEAVTILEWELGDGASEKYPSLVQRLWDLLEMSYYEGYAKRDEEDIDE